MAASDHLQGAQFMPMGDIMKLTSVDAEANNDYRALDGLPPRGTTVADIMPQKLADIDRDPTYYGAMSRSMSTTKGGLTAPIGVNGGYLVNGGHRVAEAYRQGWVGMHVTSDFEATEDRAFNKTNKRTVMPRMTY